MVRLAVGHGDRPGLRAISRLTLAGDHGAGRRGRLWIRDGGPALWGGCDKNAPEKRFWGPSHASDDPEVHIRGESGHLTDDACVPRRRGVEAKHTALTPLPTWLGA